MEKIRVLLIVPLLDQGGLERICALTAQLINKEVTLTLVVFSGKGIVYDVSGIDLLDLELGASASKLGKIKTLLRRIKALKQIKKQRNITISYSFGGTANIANVLAGGNDQKWIGIRGYDAFANQMNLKITCKLADKIICCAKVMEDDLRKIYPSKDIITIYNPCDFEMIEDLSQKTEPVAFQSFFTMEDQYVVTVGRSHEVKGYWHLLKAFGLVHDQRPHTKLVMIGDGDFSEYQQLAKDLGIEKKVLFTGLQKNPFAYMKKCHVYTLTSSSEGFPNSLVEAMAVGLPVIATNCKTGPAEILCEDYQQVQEQSELYIGDYGTLVPIMTPDKNMDVDKIEPAEVILAEEIIKILKSTEREALGAKARLRAMEFSTEEYKKHLLYQLSN